MKIGLDRQGALTAILDILIEQTGTLLEQQDDTLPSSVKVFISIVRKMAAHATGAEIKNLRHATKDDIQALLTQSKFCTEYAARANIQLDKLATQLEPVIKEAVEEALSRVESSMEALTPNVHETMTLYLQREMRREREARLEQAGHADSRPPDLASVFVDLRVADAPTVDPPGDGQKGQSLPSGILHQLVRDGCALLRPTAQRDSENDQKKPTALGDGRIVLIGGPGQGKSTITQQLCQLHRVAYLIPFRDQLPPNVRTLLEEVEKGPSAIDIPRRARLPFRVGLSRFASHLQKNKVRSLLDYLAQEVAAPERPCSPMDLRHWLVAEPWLLALDGLDEVPSTANRTAVMEAISNFVAEVHQTDADILIVATTRPQGYGGEFGPFQFREYYLAPLSVQRALAYAERFTTARYPDDIERRRRIMDRLTAGANHDATARLMRSPLQVTIMVALVDRIGEPPRERWRLFDDYFQIVCQRETERDIPAVAILREHRANVVEVHRRVALLLHSEAEAAGKTQARLDLARFRELVHNRMREEGHQNPELKQITDNIVTAALERLVLLVAPEEGQIGFEVRSLQEFMASEALCEGGDEIVRQRLLAIAPVPHWRNVFLYAAGRCFAKEQHRRDMILGICDELDHADGDPLYSRAKTGARLAAELLADGIAREQPNFLRRLVHSGTRLYDTADTEGCRLLSDLFEPRAAEEYKNALKKAISSGPPHHCWGAWAALIRLIEAGQDWAVELARAHWPSDIEVQRDVMGLAKPAITNSFLMEQAIQVKPSYPVWEVGRSPYLDMAIAHSSSVPIWWNSFASLGANDNVQDAITCRLTLDSAEAAGYALRFNPVNKKDAWRRDIPEEMDNLHDSWRPVLAAAQFAKNPTHDVLSAQLQWLAEHWKGSSAWPMLGASWLFAECIWLFHTAEDLQRAENLQQLAQAAREGRLGTHDDWIRAEDRWKERGVNPDDLEVEGPQGLPFDQRIADVGFPLWTVRTRIQVGFDTNPVVAELLAHFDRAGSEAARARWAELAIDLLETDRLFFGMRDDAPVFELSPSKLAALYRSIQHRLFMTELLRNTTPGMSAADETVLNALDEVGRFSGKHFIVSRDDFKVPSVWHTLIYDAWRQSPERTGLIRLASTLALSGCPASADVVRLIDPDCLSQDGPIRWAILRLCTDEHQVETCREFIEKYLGERKDSHLIPMISEGMQRGGRDDQNLEAYAVAAAEEVKCDLRTAGALHRQLVAAVGRRRSLLSQPESWRDLRLSAQ